MTADDVTTIALGLVVVVGVLLAGGCVAALVGLAAGRGRPRTRSKKRKSEEEAP